MDKIYILISMVLFGSISLAQTDLTSKEILKDSTVLTYEFIELNEQLGFSGSKIVEGKFQGDIIEIILVKTDNGFQLFDKSNDGKLSKSNILINNNQESAEVYAGFIDGLINTDNRSTLCLSKNQFHSPVISVAAESDDVVYKYVKGETIC